mmetsp:Transcript_9354/g.23842  ORF Transcript_9354/g.23842 Transcript_9354/m.23842 type:complete len:82 (+) Transcript_9354:155-400(+)
MLTIASVPRLAIRFEFWQNRRSRTLAECPRCVTACLINGVLEGAPEEWESLANDHSAMLQSREQVATWRSVIQVMPKIQSL